MSLLSRAVAAFRDALGAKHVAIAPDELALASAATFPTEGRLDVILRPGSRDEVRACLRIAARHRIPVQPISRGRNWGYGSRIPPAGRGALLDLSRLDRIVGFDRKLGWVSVEPGVTFRQLAGFLRRRAPELMTSVTGSTGEGSVVGNALARGVGSGPLGDRASHICELEVVLPTGECVHTGFERFGELVSAHVHARPAGPSLDGLFAQSTFGVVTRLTTWLARKPRHFAVVHFGVETTRALARAVDAIRDLSFDGTLRAPVTVWNDLRRIANAAQYPWEAAGGRVPLPSAIRSAAARQLGLARFEGILPVHAASQGALRAELRSVRAKLEAPETRASFVRVVRRPIGASRWDDTPFFGWPSDENLPAAYWRKRRAPPAVVDPERDRCGLLWLDVVVPLAGTYVRRAVDTCERIIDKHGFEPLLVAVSHSGRSIYVVPMIVFDRDVPGQDERARACEIALLRALFSAGIAPTRCNAIALSAMPRTKDAFDDVVLRIQEALDPTGILSSVR